jgi:Xaa-Pro aminopeptidase
MWLNGYHAHVREVVAPQVDDATRAWLNEATQPL